MIAWRDRADPAALRVLEDCCQAPTKDELLPLLALSVLAVGVPFSAALVAAQAAQVTASLEAAGRSGAADRLVGQCATGLQRCGAEVAAADLRESLTILRLEARRVAASAPHSGPSDPAGRNPQ